MLPGGKAVNTGRDVINVVTTKDLLIGASQRARNVIGVGRGSAYGTRVHSAFAAEVRKLGANVTCEVSYLHGRVVPYRTPGAIRVDVVEGTLIRPSAIYDLKTGGATLTPQRIRKIQQHLPGGGHIPIIEIRP